MLILRAQLLLGSKPVCQVGAVSGALGEKKFVGALADHLGAMLAYLGWLRASPTQRIDFVPPPDRVHLSTSAFLSKLAITYLPSQDREAKHCHQCFSTSAPHRIDGG